MDEERLASLDRAISAREPGEFHFPEIYGAGWNELYVGDRVKRGHEFMNLVRKGYFPQVVDSGRKKAGGRVYLKIR